MASNLLGLRKAAGYRSAGDFAEAQGIPASTYARYESNPDKIPLRAAWQIADALGTTIDAVVGRTPPEPGAGRGEVQAEYDGLTPEVRALMDEFREFVQQKDKKIKVRKAREEERTYEALCYQYERQMMAERAEGAGFGELVAFESAAEAREAFLEYLQQQAAKKRGKLATKAQKLVDDRTIERIMAAWDRAHGEFESGSMHVIWDTVDHRLDVQYNSVAGGAGGGAPA